MLEAVGDPRAAVMVQIAQRMVREYADSTTDAGLRWSFLENVAMHRAILEAAETAHTLASQPS